MLIRFFKKKEFAEQFICGSLYCNSLDYFRKYPDVRLDGNELANDKCTDLLEGSAQLLRAYFPYKELTEYVSCDPHLVFSEYAKAHVCCFSSIRKLPPKGMEQFGEWCVIIFDYKIFERKLENALNSDSQLYYLYGGVEYYEPTINRNQIKSSGTGLVFAADGIRIYFDESNPKAFIERDAFYKFLRFKSQQEWRLFLYKETYSCEPDVLCMKDLHDCCKMIHSSEISRTIREIQNEYPLCNSVPQHIKGNISRPNLNKKIIKKDPWGQLHFLLGPAERKNKDSLCNDLVKGLRIKQVNENPGRVSIRGFF